MKRIPAIILLALMLGCLIWAEHSYTSAQEMNQQARNTAAETAEKTEEGTKERSPVAEAREYLGPASEQLGANGSTWHCPAGFTTPDALNDHIVIVTNPTEHAAQGRITIFPALLNTLGNTVSFDRAADFIEVPPKSQLRYSLAQQVGSLDELLGTETGAFVGAVVEFEEAGVTVEHQITSARDIDLGPCATSAGGSWWFASGTTSGDSAYQLYLLNPFADDAVIDAAFLTDDGRRTPLVFDSRLVPARSLTLLQVSPVVPLGDQISAEISAVSGRVIAERLQILGGDEISSGVSVSLGSNRLSTQWFFPAGGALGVGSGETYLIMNPNDEPAQVEFEAKPDSADRAGDIAPISLTIGPRQRWAVTVGNHSHHPAFLSASIDATSLTQPGEGFFASVRSFNGVAVTVERVYTLPASSQDSGVSAALGADVAALEQIVSIPRNSSKPTQSTDQPDNDSEVAQHETTGVLAVLNPAGDTISQVEVYVGRGDGVEELAAVVELAQRRRAVFTLDSLKAKDAQWLRIVSSTGTIAELVTSGDKAVTSSIAVPQKGSLTVPNILAFD